MVMPERVKHWSKLALRSDYRWRQREIRRLRNIARHKQTLTTLLGKQFELVDTASFLSLYREIFEKEIYRFESSEAAPLIIDGGANIGLSVLYLKQLFPESRLIAFEPDPKIFGVLKRNCITFDLQQVELVPKALWNCETTLDFLQEGNEAGRIPRELDKGNIIRVPTARLKDYLQVPVDFLKLDIEGAETEVLRDCQDELLNVQYAFVEYHSFINSPQELSELTTILSRAGFRLHLHSLLPAPHPFVERINNFGMDMQANIFAFRS